MHKFFYLLKREIIEIFSWQKSERVWQMPFFAAWSIGVVLLIGSLVNRPDLALISMVGAMVFLYVPDTPIFHKIVLTTCLSFLMVLSFTLGLLSQFYPASAPFVVFLVTMNCAQVVRYFGIGAPGFFFFTFACVLGTFMPFTIKEIPFAIGLIVIGTMVSSVMVFLYSISVIHIFKNHKPKPPPRLGDFGFDSIIVDPFIIACFVGGSMWLQNFLGLERGYWMTVSCATVLTAMTFRSIWLKQAQRIVGTFLGAGFAYILLHYIFTPFQFALLMMLFMFLSEILVVRNYTLSIIFITPMTTYLAEAASFMNYNPDIIITARLIDIVLGSLFGLLGGAVLHFKPLRLFLNVALRKIYVRGTKFEKTTEIKQNPR